MEMALQFRLGQTYIKPPFIKTPPVSPTPHPSPSSHPFLQLPGSDWHGKLLIYFIAVNVDVQNLIYSGVAKLHPNAGKHISHASNHEDGGMCQFGGVCERS